MLPYLFCVSQFLPYFCIADQLHQVPVHIINVECGIKKIVLVVSTRISLKNVIRNTYFISAQL